MSANDIWRLQSHPTVKTTRTGTRSQSRPLFSRFELSLLVILTVSSASLVIFSLVYILQHRDSVRPAAIIAICLAGFLLAAMVVMVSRRMRRTARRTDLEDGQLKNWGVGTPIKPIRWSKQPQFDTKGLYSVIPDHRQQTPDEASFVDKVRNVVCKTLSLSPLSGSSFRSFSSSTRLLRDGGSGGPPSTETSERLWASVFELPADNKLDQFRRDNLKRLSKESRRSRHEMCASDERRRLDEGVDRLDVITRPRSTLSPSRSRRELPIKPREPQMSQSFSTSPGRLQVPNLVDVAGRGRTTTDFGNTRSEFERGRILPVVLSVPNHSINQTRTTNTSNVSRGLRRLPSPQAPGCDGQDLRTAFKEGQMGDD
ncbi:hypothetical protein QBC47DRAFT_164426 [Echria macrotheca]|uniref:Uncharacterized protein n=1 Tax=Echria macrotheca TaxID=438768 RepID=A0AAJ0BID5_9PEZI|nr:hypothetical protein QBC47DRAFT_164426 [Echria macrotheca]